MAQLEQLIAFNDEIVSLTRVGVPLELGLSELGYDTDSAVAKINAAIATRMSRGESLADAVSAEKGFFPAAYRHVVSAGLRCGRLPAALEGLARFARSLSEVRQRIAAALAYPLVVCALAYAMFVCFCLFVVPAIQQSYVAMGLSPNIGVRILTSVSNSVPIWVGIPPLLLAAMLLAWSRTAGVNALSFHGLARPLGWLPGVRKIAFDQRCANLADLLALLVENDVPLHEGLRLAADAVGEKRLRQAVDAYANSAEQGQSLGTGASGTALIPPFLRWAITQSPNTTTLVDSLRLAADTYRRRSQFRAEWLRIMLPIVACVVIGGGATLLYALSLFAPIFQMLKEIAY